MVDALSKVPPYILVIIILLIGAILWKVVGAVLDFFFKYFKGILDKLLMSIDSIEKTNQKFSYDFRLMESKIQDGVRISEEVRKLTTQVGLLEKELQTNWKKYEELCKAQRKQGKRTDQMESNLRNLSTSLDYQYVEIDDDDD